MGTISSFNLELFTYSTVKHLVAELLKVIADAIDGKNYNRDSYDSLLSDIQDLCFCMISSASAHYTHINSETQSKDMINTMIKHISFQNNELKIKIKNAYSSVAVEPAINSLIDTKSNNILLFDGKYKQWMPDESGIMTNALKSDVMQFRKFHNKEEKIIFIRRNTKSGYKDLLGVDSNGIKYALVENKIFEIETIRMNKKNNRYIAYDTTTTDGKHTPYAVIFEKNQWNFEKQSTPSLSKDVVTTLTENQQLIHDLSSKLTDLDVDSMLSSNNYQSDKNGIPHLKIAGRYYPLSYQNGIGYFIAGEKNIILLKKRESEFIFKEKYTEDIYSLSRKKTDHFPGKQKSEDVYIDNTLYEFIEAYSFYFDTETENSLQMSVIPGCASLNNNDYLPFQGKYIDIHDVGGDLYQVGDDINPVNNILLYKNAKSDTYFLFNSYIKPSRKIKVNSLCRAIRRPMSACRISTPASVKLSNILQKNFDYALKIPESSFPMEQHERLVNCYKSKHKPGYILYHFRDNIYFYAIENTLETAGPVPIHFTLYRADTNGNLDLHHAISDISLIKDFNRETSVLCTQKEGTEYVMNMYHADAEAIIRWTASDKSKVNFDANALAKILAGKTVEAAKELELGYVMNYESRENLKKLFANFGKKSVISLPLAENRIDDKYRNYFGVLFETEIKTLREAKASPFKTELPNLVEVAFHKVRRDLTTITASFHDSNWPVIGEYIIKILEINSFDARVIFTHTIEQKIKILQNLLETMEIDKLLLMSVKKDPRNPFDLALLTAEQQQFIGGVINGDPLNRIFINSEFFSEVNVERFKNALPDSDGYLSSDSLTPLINFKELISEKERFKANIIYETLIHEASHLVNSGWDNFYLPLAKRGEMMETKYISDYIGKQIKKGSYDEFFIDLCKSYFIKHTIFKKYKLSSLLRNENLYLIYQKDDFLRSIAHLQNADSLAVIIRDISKRLKSNP